MHLSEDKSSICFTTGFIKPFCGASPQPIDKSRLCLLSGRYRSNLAARARQRWPTVGSDCSRRQTGGASSVIDRPRHPSSAAPVRPTGPTRCAAVGLTGYRPLPNPTTQRRPLARLGPSRLAPPSPLTTAPAPLKPSRLTRQHLPPQGSPPSLDDSAH